MLLIAAFDLAKPSSTNSSDFLQGLFPSFDICMDRYKRSLLPLVASFCDQDNVTKT